MVGILEEVYYEYTEPTKENKGIRRYV